jgi:hypothetical protein
MEQHRKKENSSESCPNDELFQKVWNNDVYKEFMKLELGKMKIFESRNYVRGNAADLIKLMNQISNCMNCNKKRKSALGDSVDVEIEQRDAVVADSVDVDIEKRDAVVALLSLAATGGGGCSFTPKQRCHQGGGCGGRG